MTIQEPTQLYCIDCDAVFSFDNNEEFVLHCDHKFKELKQGEPHPGLLKDFARHGLPTEPEEEKKLSEYAGLIMAKYIFQTLTDTKEILWYDNGAYKQGGEVLIQEECQKLIDDCSRYKVGEIIAIIQRKTFVDRKKFNRDLTKLVFNNGVFDLKNNEFMPDHNPEFLTTIKMDYDYDATARCPMFLKLLEDVLEEPEKIITMIELMANVFTMSYKNFEVSLIMVGDGSNGKSTILKILRGILGPDNVSSVSIHAMQAERFSISRLDGKIANIYPDISNKELWNLGRFKMAVSGDAIDVERKGKDLYSITPFAKHFFSANEMPDIKDNSDGAFRRIYVLRFDNEFLPGLNRIEDYDKIILEKESPGIFNLLYANYRNLLRNNGFRFKQSIAQVRETIKKESDKLLEFISTCFVKSEQNFIASDILYQKYTQYCKDKAYDPYPQAKFTSNLSLYGFRHGQKKIEKKNHKGWFGYDWNFDEEFVKTNVRKGQLSL